MTPSFPMRQLLRVLALLSIALLPRPALAAGPTLFRLFLTDGTDVVSYGEYARVGEDVIFSMAVGSGSGDPHLQLVTLPTSKVDWNRTERYSESARAEHYASTRGDEEFAQLSNEVARVLNDIALSPDRGRALALAQQAHNVLAQWPQDHYHYRDAEIRDILQIIDSAIANLRGEPANTRFDLSLVASTVELPREPLDGMPAPKVQLTQLLHVADLTPRAADRMALFNAALALLDDAGTTVPAKEAAGLREKIRDRIDHENDVDQEYTRLTQRLSAEATRAAAAARATEVERVIAKVTTEDRKLGSARPETVDALRAALQAKLEDARRLRLLRDQWIVRRKAYQEYERRVGGSIVQLVKAQPQLESIRRLEGPAPDRLFQLKTRLDGGADRLQRLEVPSGMESTHGLLIGAWRFAENAASARYDAVRSGNVNTAWTASSAAAGALMMLSRAQDELRKTLEIPTLK